MSKDHGPPDDATLLQGLTKLLRPHMSTQGTIQVLERQSNIYTSTFSSEIVSCQLGDEEALELLIKYGEPGAAAEDPNRGGLDFEAAVYREVLNPLSLPAVKYYGVHRDEASGYTWLVLEYLGTAKRLNRSPEEALRWCACWLGQFHAASEVRLMARRFPLLNQHTIEYYVGWARRTEAFSRPLHAQYPWMPALCQRFEARAPLLASGHQTIIHGEYYPMNILVNGKRVYPIDWQSAATARGEIDLASLIEGWSRDHGELVQQSIEAYGRARWGDDAPADFPDVLKIAQVYWPLRWLGEEPKWTLHPRYEPHYEYLRQAGERAGLIP